MLNALKVVKLRSSYFLRMPCLSGKLKECVTLQVEDMMRAMMWLWTKEEKSRWLLHGDEINIIFNKFLNDYHKDLIILF